MRLLTHNTLANTSAAAKGHGFPLRITVKKVRVEEGAIDERQIQLVRNMLPTIDWPALVKVRTSIYHQSMNGQTIAYIRLLGSFITGGIRNGHSNTSTATLGRTGQ